MSRVSVIVDKPAKRYLQWSSENQTFQYWDRDAEENVNISLPFQFVVLNDDYTTWKGYNDKAEAGIYSNEVKDISQKSKETMTVICGKKVVAEGTYQEIKEKVKAIGGKYTKSIYVAVKNEDGDYEVWNLQIKGGALTGGQKQGETPAKEDKLDGWIAFSNDLKRSLYGKEIQVANIKPKKNKATKYVIPIFEVSRDLTAEENSFFDEMTYKLDETLKDYKAYLKSKSDDAEKTETEDVTTSDVEDWGETSKDEDDLPF